MQKPKKNSIRRIIMHEKPHADELAALVILRWWGKLKFPGVEKAKISLFGGGRMLEARNLHEDTIAIGVGGGMFDVNPETATKKSSSSKKAYSYVSMVNGKIEIDHDWDTCKKRVHGESNARYKKVVSAEEERSLIAEWKALGLSDIR